MNGEKPSGGFVFTANTSDHPPDKPWDCGQVGDSNPVRVSFRDKVLGDRGAPPPREEVDFFEHGLAKLDFLGGNRLLPSITFDEKVIKEASSRWQDVLIVTLLGKKLGFCLMQDKLKAMWRLQSGFDLMDIANGTIW